MRFFFSNFQPLWFGVKVLLDLVIWEFLHKIGVEFWCIFQFSFQWTRSCSYESQFMAVSLLHGAKSTSVFISLRRSKSHLISRFLSYAKFGGISRCAQFRRTHVACLLHDFGSLSSRGRVVPGLCGLHAPAGGLQSTCKPCLWFIITEFRSEIFRLPTGLLCGSKSVWKQQLGMEWRDAKLWGSESRWLYWCG